MLEALWSVEFMSSLKILGAGTAVFETNRILGGDNAFTYVGSYDVKNGIVTAKIKVTKYTNLGAMQSVFGELNEFNLNLSGEAHSKEMSLSGSLVENPSLQIVIKAVRRAELP